MCGLVLGTLCLIALLKVARGGCHGGWGYGRRWGGGCHGGARMHGPCGPGGWHGHGHGHGAGPEGGPPSGWGWGGGWGMERAMLRALFERLDTTPGQEKVLREALAGLRAAGRENWGALRTSRDEVARAFTAESFDEAVLGGSFARQDEAMQAMRKAVAEALLKVHAALEPEQRRRLAELLTQGRRGFGPMGMGPAPYRF